MGPGPKAGSFAAECGEAEETLTCLACVCVTEVRRDGGGEGYQWATAGVPQSQPFTCCDHSRQMRPRSPANNLSRSQLSRLRTLLLKALHVTSSIHLAQRCQLVPLALVSHVSLTSTPDKQLKSEQTMQKCRVYHKTNQFLPFTCAAVHLFNFALCSTSIWVHHCARKCRPKLVSFPFLSFICFSCPSLWLSGTSSCAVMLPG